MNGKEHGQEEKPEEEESRAEDEAQQGQEVSEEDDLCWRQKADQLNFSL